MRYQKGKVNKLTDCVIIFYKLFDSFYINVFMGTWTQLRMKISTVVRRKPHKNPVPVVIKAS